MDNGYWQLIRYKNMSVGSTEEMGTGRSKEREIVDVEAAGELEQRLREIGVDISESQLRAMLGTEGLQSLLGSLSAQAFSPEALADIEKRAGEAGKLTPEEEKLISQAASLGFQQGASDIDSATQKGLQLLRQELAPSRGLRSTDTPILDRGGQIVGEGIRQKGQLGLGLQQQAAGARLAFPLQRQSFQEQLRNRAFQNRLALSGQALQGGLGLAGLFNPSSFANQFLQERLGGKDITTRESFKGRKRTDEIEYKFGGT